MVYVMIGVKEVMTMTKCVKCGSEMFGGKWDRYCSNDECILSYRKPKEPFDWTRFWWKIFHPDFKSIYYNITNTLFKRYDLIRTNTGMGNWCDKDYSMFYGMMGLLVDYIEIETQGEYFSLDGWGEYTDDNNKAISSVIRDLYIDYKVTYQKMVQDEDDSLDAWSKSSKMIFGETDEHGLSQLHFETTSGYTNEKRQILFDKHIECEKLRNEYEQELLHRLVDIRQYLWT